MIVFDSDDFGVNHVISDQCQSHDCRDALLKLKEINPAFKATLFTIPGEMTPELLLWSNRNSNWIQLAVHGLYHTSNYECEKMSYREFDEEMMHTTLTRTLSFFEKGFKAPGWQISDDIYKWLLDHGWWVADQGYNDTRRPKGLSAYLNYDGKFYAYKGLHDENFEEYKEPVEGIHTHCWDCVGNGIYELFDEIAEKIKDETDFRFVSEVVA